MLYRFGRFELDTDEHRLASGGVPILLEPKTLLLLGYLVSHAGKLIRKQELLDAVWPNAAVTENAITRSITLARRALEDSSREPRFIETVPKIGYRFIAEVNVAGSGAAAPDSSFRGSQPGTVEPAGDSNEEQDTGEGQHAASPKAYASPSAQRLSPSWGRVGVAISIVLLTAVGLWALAHRAAAAGTSASGNPSAASSSTATSNQDAAREEVRRGLFFYDQRNGPASEAAFRHAIELDPQSSSAHAGLAQALITRSLLAPVTSPEVVASAEEEGRKAVALDPANGDAYIALGTVQTTFTWEWSEGEKNLKRGLQISPHNAVGNMCYAIYLDSAGRPEEAIQRVQIAVDAEPLSFFMLRQQASVLYLGRHYDEALRILERAREMSPAQGAILDNWVAWIDEQRGLYDEAVEHDLSRQRKSLRPLESTQLRVAYRGGGWTAYWKLRLKQMDVEKQAGCGLNAVGRAYLRVGDRDQAFRYLQKAAEQHCFWLGQVLVDPGLDDLRQDARFSQLVAKVDPKRELSGNHLR